MKRKPHQTQTTNKKTEVTFLEHLYELRRRVFWVVATILAVSAAAFPFLNNILYILTAPLGGQQLYYLTPVGGFSFSIKICMFVGIAAAVPVMVYHLYRYLEPIMSSSVHRSAAFYIFASSFLAATGIAFAYFVSLPGALHFLTGMNLNNIQAMLTADSYLTFVTAYLLGSALLFQIPLILLIINTATPIKPGLLGKSQRFVIVGAFIVAAIISPTPDIMNQLLLAIPIIVMYQVGVLLVWLQNRSRAKNAVTLPASTPVEQQQIAVKPEAPVQTPAPRPVMAARPLTSRRATMDGIMAARYATASSRPSMRVSRPRPVMRRTSQTIGSIDGLINRQSNDTGLPKLAGL